MSFVFKKASEFDLAQYRGVDKPDPGFVESFRAAKKAAELNDTSVSEANALEEVWAPIIEEMNSRGSGQTFYNPAISYRTAIFNENTQEANYSKAIGNIFNEIETNETFADLRGKFDRDTLFEQAAQLARDSRQDYLNTVQNISTTSSAIGKFAGGAVGAIDDPVLVGSMLFGGAKGLWQMAFQEAALGAGSEAIIQTKVKEWYASTGQEYTDEQFWNAVKFGAAAGFATPFAFRGAGEVINVSGKAVNLTVDQLKSGVAALRSAGVKSTSEGRLLEQLADDVQAVDEINPLASDVEIQAQAEHQSRVQDATAAVERNQAPTIPDAPKVPPRAVESAYEADNLDGTIYRFDPDELQVDAELFQFKSGGDEFGVTERLQGIKTWDAVKAGQVTVFEKTDGSRFIADGHQRMGLAKRIKAQDPSQDVRLYGHILREVDGYTEADARVIAAVKNIAEGTGTALDAAKILKDAPERIGELPPKSRLVQQANGLVMLSNKAFGAIINNVVPANYGAIVGRLIPDDEGMQDAAIAVLNKTQPANEFQAESIVRQVMDAGAETRTQESLFGEEIITESYFAERAKVLDQAVKQLSKDKAAFASLVRNQQRLEAEGNQLAQAANQRRAENDSQAIGLLQALANRKGALSDALTAAAKQAREAGSYGRATDGFIEAVRRAIQEGDFDRLAAGDAGRIVNDTAQGSPRPAEPEPDVSLFDDPKGQATREQADQLETDVITETELRTEEPEEPVARREGTQEDEGLRQQLKELLDSKAPEEEIDNHPAVITALEQAEAIPKTNELEGFGTAAFQENRIFNFDGEEVVGYFDAIMKHFDNAATLAYKEMKMPVPDLPIRYDGEATILIGPPAAGKSTIANPLAVNSRASIIDSDEIKKTLPEYENGIGAMAVHEESSEIAQELVDAAMSSKTNMVIPKVGDNPATIEKLGRKLKKAGYKVKILEMKVPYQEARRRMFGRFLNTGRLIGPDYVRYVGDKPSETYNILKERGEFDGYASIKNDQPKDQLPTIIDDAFNGPEARNTIATIQLVRSGEISRGALPEPARVPEEGARPITDDATEEAPAGFLGMLEDDARESLLAFRNQIFEEMEGPEIPIGSALDESGNAIAVTMTRREMLDEFEQDRKMLDRLRDCVK